VVLLLQTDATVVY